MLWSVLLSKPIINKKRWASQQSAPSINLGAITVLDGKVRFFKRLHWSSLRWFEKKMSGRLRFGSVSFGNLDSDYCARKTNNCTSTRVKKSEIAKAIDLLNEVSVSLVSGNTSEYSDIQKCAKVINVNLRLIFFLMFYSNLLWENYSSQGKLGARHGSTAFNDSCSKVL